jgi:hypothetical protein
MEHFWLSAKTGAVRLVLPQIKMLMFMQRGSVGFSVTESGRWCAILCAKTEAKRVAHSI